jgi:hypothetical protein
MAGAHARRDLPLPVRERAGVRGNLIPPASKLKRPLTLTLPREGGGDHRPRSQM